MTPGFFLSRFFRIYILVLLATGLLSLLYLVPLDMRMQVRPLRPLTWSIYLFIIPTNTFLSFFPYILNLSFVLFYFYVVRDQNFFLFKGSTLPLHRLPILGLSISSLFFALDETIYLTKQTGERLESIRTNYFYRNPHASSSSALFFFDSNKMIFLGNIYRRVGRTTFENIYVENLWMTNQGNFQVGFLKSFDARKEVKDVPMTFYSVQNGVAVVENEGFFKWDPKYANFSQNLYYRGRMNLSELYRALHSDILSLYSKKICEYMVAVKINYYILPVLLGVFLTLLQRFVGLTWRACLLLVIAGTGLLAAELYAFYFTSYWGFLIFYLFSISGLLVFLIFGNRYRRIHAELA